MSAHTFEHHDDGAEKALLDALPQPAIPVPDALPADIRDFLTETLSTSRGLSHDHARAIADKWRLGTGRELRSYPPKMYLEIFGHEEGWCVYSEVKTRLLKQTRQKGLAVGDRIVLIGLSLLCIVLAYYLFPAVRSSSRALSLRAMSFVVFGILVGGGLLFWIVAMQSPRPVEEQVEQELASVFAEG